MGLSQQAVELYMDLLGSLGCQRTGVFGQWGKGPGFERESLDTNWNLFGAEGEAVPVTSQRAYLLHSLEMGVLGGEG